MNSVQVKNICGLSPVQEGMYFHYLMDRLNDPYIIQSQYELEGVVDVARLKGAFELLVARHDSLRTLFMHQKTPDPVQIILSKRDIPYEYHDVCDLPEPESVIREYLESDRKKGFDLSRDPLVRVALFRVGDGLYRLVMTLHHIIQDGWSSGVIEKELFNVYAGAELATFIKNKPPFSFTEYIKWLKNQPENEGVEYFKKIIPSDAEVNPFTKGTRPATQLTGIHKTITQLDEDTTRQLKSLAIEQQVTLSDLLRVAWYLSTCKITGSERFTTLHTVSGRPASLSGSSEMVGMFINALAQPVTISDQTIVDFLRQHHQQFAESLTWQHISMSKVAKSIGVQSELADSLLVFENYPDLGDERTILEKAMGFRFRPLSSEEATNYPVTIQFHIGTTIEVRYFLKKNRFTAEDLQQFERTLNEVIGEIIRDPFQSVMKFLPKRNDELPADPLSLYVSSNFTDNSIQPYLQWWLEEAGFSPEITLADYNTVIQDTMSPESLLFTHSGPSLILLKVLDLARFRYDLSGEGLEEYLIETVTVIARNLKKYPSSFPLCIALTPEQPELIENLSASRYERVISHLQSELSNSDPIKLLDLRQTHLAFADLFDAKTNEIGHIPYTEAGYSYLASQLARALRAWKYQPFKVIVLDADNTLWKGVLGEDGVEGVQLSEEYKMLQTFMLKCRNEGFLLALCTKNNQLDIDELFSSRDDMILKSSDFVSIKANWNAKSGNIREIAQELNLGLDSFIFLDDSSLEIEEVSSVLSDVLALKLPEQASQWKMFLSHIWAFDTFNVTNEDRERTKMYQAESKRREIAEQHDQKDDFIAQLNVKTEFIHSQEVLLPRIEQLTQRTNQFNLNGRRFTLPEVKSYIERPDHQVFALSVSDQFGDYGITGALFIRFEEKILHVDAWMLSCRVLARGVEHHVIHFLSTIASGKGVTIIHFHHTKTAKNIPIQHVMSGEVFEAVSSTDGDISIREFICENAEKVPVLGSFELVEAHKLSQAPKISKDSDRQVDIRSQHSESSHEKGYDQLPETSGMSLNHNRNKRYLIGINNLHPGRLQDCRNIKNNPLPVNLSAYVEPISQSEQQIAAIWRDLLDVNQVGREDNFFNLGGNSLMATRMASGIFKLFGFDIDLKILFENPVLHELAAIIDTLESGGTERHVEVIKVIQADSYPLSDSQLRIWRSEQVFDMSAGYTLGGAYRIEGDFDIERLSKAIEVLMSRHSALRTIFPQINGEPRQVILKDVTLPVRKLDLSGLTDDLSQAIDDFFTTRFDLENGPLLAIAYHCNSADEHILAIKIHHLVTDGWSQGIVMQQLLDFYHNGSELKHEEAESTVRFVDFVHWQQNQAESQQSEWKRFWEKELSEEYERFELASDYPRPATIKKSTQQLSVLVEDELRSKVDAFSRRNRLSLYMTMMAGVHIMIQKYTGSSDTIIGSPFSGRTHPSVQDTVGFFVNTLPFRMTSEPDQSLSSWLNDVRDKTIQMVKYQHVSLDSILNHIDYTVTDNRPPLFDVLVLVQEESDTEEPKTSGLTIQPYSSEHLGAGYDLVFQIFSSRHSWRLVIEYQPELFHPRTIRAMGEHWKAVLENLSKADDRALLSEIAANNSEIKETLKRLGRGAKREFPDQTLLEVFESAVARNPEGIAVIDEKSRVITYEELNKQTTTLALRLVDRGVRPGDRVIVNTELKSHAIMLMLALFKCRAIYVPIDSETPVSRLDFITETCNPLYRITDVPEAYAEGEVPVLSVRQLLDESISDTVDLPERGDPGETAYIIFTSGSTGRPKGVEVHHRGLVNMTHAFDRLLDLNDSDRVLCFASISFDASLSEFFMGFMPGATLICPDNSIKKDAFEFVDFMNRMKVSAITLPPVFLASLNRPELPHLKMILTAGEAARKSDALHYAGYKRYINAYGPTECSVGSNAHVVHSDGFYPSGIPIGTAYDNVQLAVLDTNLQLAPLGAVGQLAINGVQVAKGYYGSPELTGKVFIQHPEFEGRTYLTGDLVRWNVHGQLEFIGRNDNQVKVRGYRIELDEIKHQFEQIAGVSFAHIQVKTDSSGDKQIMAWLVEEYPVTDEAIRSALSKQLPTYMIPVRFIRVPEIKLTINGKVDIKALPNPFKHGSGRSIPVYIGDNPKLKILSEALVNYLTGTIDIANSFMMNGGDSIKAIQITNYLKNHGYPIRAGLLYEVSRMEDLAEHMTHLKDHSTGRPILKPGVAPCTPMQQWFFHEVKEQNQRNVFWMQAGFTIEKVLTQDFIRQMIDELVSHHELFRIRFNLRDYDKPTAVIGSKPMVHIQMLDGESTDFTVHLTKYQRSLDQIIDFEQGPLAAFLVVQKQNSTQILCTLHHLIIDAMSLRLIRDQLQWMLDQHEKGESYSLETGYITVQQWTDRCDSIMSEPGFESEREYWKSIYLQMRSHFEMVDSGIMHGVKSVFLSQDHSAGLLDICKTTSQKPEHVLLAACLKAISEFTGIESFSVDLESQGRESLGRVIDTGTTLGWFTTEYPFLVTATEKLSDLISEIASHTSKVKNDGLAAVMVRNEIYESALQLQKPDLGFNYLGQFDTNESTYKEWEWDDSLVPIQNEFSHQWHPLELSAMVENGSIQIRLQSNTPSIDPDGLEEILRRTRESLTNMASSVKKDIRPVIVFFPFVASNAQFFETFKLQLEPEFKVVVLELPGHGKRIDEPFAESLEVACNDLLLQIYRAVTQSESMFWVGHSMGAYLGSKCLQLLSAGQKQLPDGFLISDVVAPGQFDAWIVGDMTPAQRNEYYSRMGYDLLLSGLDPASQKYAEQLIREDLKLVRQFVDPLQPQITIPVHFLYSNSDSEPIKIEDVQGWQAICDYEIKSSVFEGGHIDWLEKTQNTAIIKDWIQSIFQLTHREKFVSSKNSDSRSKHKSYN